MSIVLLHSLWYLLNFLWGLLRPKHFNYKTKQYYSRAREEGNCVLFQSISSESTVSWCVLPSQCCVLQSQLLCTAKLAVVYCKVSCCVLQSLLTCTAVILVYCRLQGQLMCTYKAKQGLNFRNPTVQCNCNRSCEKFKQIQYCLGFCVYSCQKLQCNWFCIKIKVILVISIKINYNSYLTVPVHSKKEEKRKKKISYN